MNWTIEFFNESVEKETLFLPPKILAKMLHIFELIEVAGAKLGEPYTKPLSKGLFEGRKKYLLLSKRAKDYHLALFCEKGSKNTQKRA